jgi:hypothetical protein
MKHWQKYYVVKGDFILKGGTERKPISPTKNN